MAACSCAAFSSAAFFASSSTFNFAAFSAAELSTIGAVVIEGGVGAGGAGGVGTSTGLAITISGSSLSSITTKPSCVAVVRIVEESPAME